MDEQRLLEEGTTREIAGKRVVASYGNDETARRAYREGVAIADRSHWGLIRLTGSTRHAFLHNLTTNDILTLQPGEGRDTVFLTSTARCVDLALVLATEESFWLIVSPERLEILMGWIPRFIFFNDDVQFTNERDRYALFSLLGPQSDTILEQLGGETIAGPYGQHKEMTLAGGEELRVIGGSGLLGKGYTLQVPVEQAETVWKALREAGSEPMGTNLWESLRVEQGRPAADRELTEAYNPLELGLWDAISFSKGCYIGQEIVARLDTYQKLKQQLWGLRLTEPVQPGAPILVEDREVGTVTSTAESEQGPFALGMIRTKAGGEGLRVQIDGKPAEVVDLPFITRARKDI